MIQPKHKIIRARVGGVRSISLSNPVEIPLDRSSVLAGQNSSGKSSTILGLRLLESYFNSCDKPFDSLSMPIAKTTFGEDLALNPASIFF